MASYYVVPPLECCRDTFIVSIEGVGYVRGGDKSEYRLVEVTESLQSDEERVYVYTFYFKSGQDHYECSPSFPPIDGLPAAKLRGEFVVAPDALRPFSHPKTIIRRS